ncbi:hypothetical protein TNCV_2618461 [Trichonephila clavipes]|nr:hypothetical protein TNCV_2618461 [Trichonephila clavipes]
MMNFVGLDLAFADQVALVTTTKCICHISPSFGGGKRFLTILRIKGRNGHLRYLLDEVETDQAKEELDEIMDINHGSESKFEKRDERETFELKGKFSNTT